MAEFAAMPFFTDWWIAKTAHLSRCERGLLHDLLVLVWRSPECRVPNDVAWIMRRLRCTPDEQPMLETIVDEFMQSTGNWLSEPRIRKEFEYVRSRNKKQSVRAKSRWEKEKETCRGNAPTPTPTPTPTSVVSNDTTQPREALEALEHQLRNAAGWQSEPAPMLSVTGEVQALIAAGAILETDVLPVVRALAPKVRNRTSWKFFIPAIVQARDDRIAAATRVSPPSPIGTAVNGSHHVKPTRADFFAEIDRRINELEALEHGTDQGGPDHDGMPAQRPSKH